MEEWRTAPSLMMAANRSPLAERVVRLLGLHEASGRTRAAWHTPRGGQVPRQRRSPGAKA
jgi:hypothetical protein